MAEVTAGSYMNKVGDITLDNHDYDEVVLRFKGKNGKGKCIVVDNTGMIYVHEDETESESKKVRAFKKLLKVKD